MLARHHGAYGMLHRLIHLGHSVHQVHACGIEFVLVAAWLCTTITKCSTSFPKDISGVAYSCCLLCTRSHAESLRGLRVNNVDAGIILGVVSLVALH